MSTDAVPHRVQQRLPDASEQVDHATVIDLRFPLEHTLPPAAAPTRQVPRWVLDFQTAGLRPLPVLADALLGFAAASAIGGLAAAVFAGCFVTAAGIVGVYARRPRLAAAGIQWYIRAAALPFAVAALAAVIVAGPSAAVAAAAGMLAVLAVRTVAWWYLAVQRRAGADLEPVLVVGDPATTVQVERRLDMYPELGVRPGFRVALTDDASRAVAIQRLRLGDYPHLVLAGTLPKAALAALLDAAGVSTTTVTVVPTTSPAALARSRYRLGDLSMLPLGRGADHAASRLMRAFDVVASAVALLVLLPVLGLVALAIVLEDKGPALYRQHRVGRDGKPFEILKFRSMHVGAEDLQQSLAHINDAEGLLFKISQDPRVTRVGTVIRRFSLDELPQLFNVLRGDMALVGPRPLAVQPEHFGTREALRHRVRPGVTGLWQVSGGNLLSYAEMIELDLAWLATRSFAVDLGIILRTVPAVLWPRRDYRRRL